MSEDEICLSNLFAFIMFRIKTMDMAKKNITGNIEKPRTLMAPGGHSDFYFLISDFKLR